MIMFNLINTINPTIVGTIIGALVGSISAWSLSYFTEKRRLNKKKKGAYEILKSEFEVNIDNLKKYKKNYLSKTSEELYDTGTLNDINEFYHNLTMFPLLNHYAWNELIDFIPYVFENDEIKKIIQFNAQLDELSKQIKSLSNKGMPNRTYSGFYLFELDSEEYKETLNNYIIIKNNINNIINYGENIF